MRGAVGVAPALARALIDSVWQVAVLAVLAAISWSLLQRRSAAVRHAVGLGFLLAMVLVPVVSFALAHHAPSPPWLGGGPPAARPPGPLLLQGTDWLALVVPLGWLVGAGVMLARQLGGWRVVVGLDRGPAPALPGAWLERVEVLRAALGIARPVAVRATRTVSPFTARALRPVIWLPAALWSRLSAEQRDVLLAHELAHVRRLDWLWNGLQSAVEAVLWFHPAVRWLSRRVREDREHACDDLAVATCGDPIALAEALATLERQRLGGLVLAAQGGSLVQRIARLLACAPPRPRIRVPIGLVIVLCGGAALATQLELPRDGLIDLRIDASVAGPLTPGTFREITADAFHARRRYRGRMDDQGRVVEIYEEDGVARPIDPAVRAWLDELGAARYMTAR